MSKIIFRIFAIVFLCFTGLVYSQAPDSSIYTTEEIGVISNKVNASIFLSPGRIDVLNKSYFENVNGSYLSDVLLSAGGVFVKNYGSNSLSTVSLNGLGAEHTLILLNGFKLNSAQNNLFDLNLIRKDNIERIEIMNNGSSSIYGSEAIGGVINIVTERNIENRLNVAIDALAGSYGHKSLTGSIGTYLGGFDARFNFSGDVSDNNYNYYFGTGTDQILKQRENSGYKYSDYGLDLKYKIDERMFFSIYSSYLDRDQDLPGIEAGSAPSTGNQRDRNWNSIASINKTISSAIVLKSDFNYQNNITNYSDDYLNSYYKNIAISNSTRLDFSQNGISVASGFDMSYYTLTSNETEEGINRFQPAVYSTARLSIGNSLNIFPGIRYEYVSDIKKNVVSGKFGINLKPFEDYNFNLKASAGNNFASPTFNELYRKGIGNDNLKPETSFNTDAGLITGFSFFSENVIEVSYTYIDATDKIIWIPKGNGIWLPENIGKSETNSVTASLKSVRTITDEIKAGLNLNYTFANSVKKNKSSENDPTYDKQIYYIPRQLFKLGLTFEYKYSGFNLFYDYTGKRYTDFENRNYLPSINLFNGNVSQKLKFNKSVLRFEFEVNNIFNENYQVVSGYPMPLRNYNFKIGVEY